ncbi:MAG: hypothetical protein OEW19_05880, partial [Acidobacteriota bacterium]|nr:hypothetical protein [Acidobacteriota bacterium]
HRITLSGGATFTGGYDIGDATALLRGNAVGPSAPPFTLFRSETSVDAAAAGDVRVGYAFARSLSVEASFGYSRPGLTTRLSQDAEAPGVTLDAERLAQYVIDVGVLWQLPRPVIAGRMRPFVIGGAGYLRQLYSERSLVETGRVYFAGGGLRYWLRGGDGTRRSLGVRGDLRAQWRAGGVEFAGRVRIVPIAAIYVFAEL